MKKENIIGLRVLRENIETYVSAVERGESFLVMRRSTPIFKIMPVDEWGDEGDWDNSIDFRKIDPRGVPVEAVLEALKNIRDKENRKNSKKTRHKKAR